MERLGRGQWYYRNLLLLGSLLSAGNVVDYFITHTEKLVVIYLLPRWDTRKNFVEIYEYGELKKRYELFSPKIIFFQYPVFFFQYVKTLFSCFHKNEHFFVITYHPLLFFFKSIIRHFRSYDMVFWIADYFPKPNFFLKLYQGCIPFFHRRNTYNIYLTDRINKVMNKGVAKNSYTSRTIMWGVKAPKTYKKVLPKDSITLFYHGVIRDEHGIELLLDLPKNDRKIKLKILGRCDDVLYKKYTEIIKNSKITDRVYLPNRYVSLQELEKEAKGCLAAAVLYKVSKNNFTFYADPGKVKTYAQLGLPIIVTKGSEVGEYIQKYKAGEIIERDLGSLTKAVYAIADNYQSYINGLKKFNNYFNIEKYYKRNFAFIEEKQ